jgi:hypothetical protein
MLASEMLSLAAALISLSMVVEGLSSLWKLAGPLGSPESSSCFCVPFRIFSRHRLLNEASLFGATVPTFYKYNLLVDIEQARFWTTGTE